MSYVRFGEQNSDVYVYFSTGRGYVCCSCHLVETPFSVEKPRAVDMIRHLEEHVAAGDTVPKRAFDRLLADTENASGAWEST